MLRIEFRLDMRAIPLLMPTIAEIAVIPANTAMTISHIIGLEVIPVKEVIPELNCRAANPKEVASPSTVAMMASSSTTTPAPRCDHLGRMSTVASLKVNVLPRLWCE
ncbi:hypothetical protein GcLGCM259_2773 [Glutamicibacter creatinolyticus]|uniref:Uncharacterized protein n=1 Tax=Glutamicibacter creatinolyticus TaxID=162496 RepID=A0A5B7WYX2_9MICC|nr:hypothetical protein GcLGCM259_2773 [Glutamicibacter creatinolyticus]